MGDRVVQFRETNKNQKHAPVVTTWKDCKMIRNHSIRATVHEIVEMSKTLDVVKINIVGDPSTGKTTLAETIAHLVHKMSDIPFAIKFLNENHLMNFEEMLANLTPTNYVMIFDDVSFMGGSSDRKTIEKVKQAFTKIRHLKGGQDVKIIAIFNIHYSKALDKYLRMSHFEYFTSIGNSETSNAIEHLGVKYTGKIRLFQKIWLSAFGSKKSFAYELGNKKKFIYLMRQPFAPLLFSNGLSVRHCVFPRREWIDNFCAICARKKDTELMDQNSKTIDEIRDELIKTHHKETVQQAIKIKLITQGVNAYSKRVHHAMKALEELLPRVPFSMEQLAIAFNIPMSKGAILRKDKKIHLQEPVQEIEQVTSGDGLDSAPSGLEAPVEQ
jgi:nicotinamide riboside kinase